MKSLFNDLQKLAVIGGDSWKWDKKSPSVFDDPFTGLSSLLAQNKGYRFKGDYLFIDIPGHAKKDVSVTLDGHTIEVTSKGEDEFIENVHYIIDLNRKLNHTISIEDAKVENGLLSMKIVYKENSTRVSVEIQ